MSSNSPPYFYSDPTNSVEGIIFLEPESPKKKEETVSMDLEPSPSEKKTPVLKFYNVERIDQVGHEEFESMVVAAYSEDDARTIHPWGSDASKHEVYAGIVWVPEEKQHTLEVTELVPEHFTRGVISKEFKPYKN